MRKIVIVVVVLALLGGYFYISRQEKLVINEKGHVTGLGNKFRALVQRSHFWEEQLKLATGFYNKSIEPHAPSSADIQELYRKYRQAEDSLNKKMKDLYTPDEMKAEEFRIKADSIIRASKWKLGDEKSEAVRKKDTEAYKRIITSIEKRIKK
jgi:hypothetical protein